MSALLILASIVVSFISTCVMSYLAVGIEITFWVAPVVTLLFLLLSIAIGGKNLSKDKIVMLLAAGSLGEMIGLAIGFSWPTLYFLHKNIFLSWMEHPIPFAGMIALLVVAAGGLAAVIAYGLRSHLITNQEFKFPTARIVYNLIYRVDKNDNNMLAKGVLFSGLWSSTALIFRKSLQGFWLLQVHTIPTLVSMGFVAGHLTTKPLVLGMMTRLVALQGFKDLFFEGAKEEDFILTFALGMLLAVVCKRFYLLVKKLYFWMQVQNWDSDFSGVKNYARKQAGLICSVVAILFCCFVLHHWHMNFAQQCYMIIAVTIACMILAAVFAEMGVLDLPSFGSFVVVPLGYLFYVSHETQLIAFVFAAICLGLVITLLFSWKVADLAKISFSRVVKYQVLGFVVAAVSVGFIIWWYATVLNFDADSLFSSQALLQEKFITLQLYDLRVLVLGFACAIGLYFASAEMSLVITGCIMDFAIVGWVVIAGVVAYFVKDREKYYPLCFGIYASHAIWLFVQALF